MQKYEYLVHSQWAGWWGGYGSEPLLQREITLRAAQGWRLASTKTDKFMWFGVSVWPPAIIAFRTRVLYVFEREVGAGSINEPSVASEVSPSASTA